MLLQSGCINACSEPQTRALPRQAAAATSTPKSAKPEELEIRDESCPVRTRPLPHNKADAWGGQTGKRALRYESAAQRPGRRNDVDRLLRPRSSNTGDQHDDR